MGMPTGRYRKGQATKPADALDSPHLTDERELDTVDHLIPLADEVDLSPTHLATAFTTTHPGVTSTIIGPRTTGPPEDLLARTATTLDDTVPDRIDETMAPGTTPGPLDVTYTQRALTRPALRRPADERAAA